MKPHPFFFTLVAFLGMVMLVVIGGGASFHQKSVPIPASATAVRANLDQDITLTVGQTVHIAGTQLEITFSGINEGCVKCYAPECAAPPPCMPHPSFKIVFDGKQMDTTTPVPAANALPFDIATESFSQNSATIHVTRK